MTAREQLLKELFEDSVSITEGKFGMYAQWENNIHPDNPDFEQTVIWSAFENRMQGHITISYRLSYQQANGKITERLPLKVSFNDVLFNFWKNQQLANK